MPNKKKTVKKSGVVKAFSEKRGVGYIKTDDDEEYVVHYSEIDLPGYAVLESGQFVEFEVDEDDDERTAQKVRPEAD